MESQRSENHGQSPIDRPNRRSITGSIRDNREGKGRYDLESPISRRVLVECLEKGADAYEARNWELGQPLSWYYDSGSRHLTNYWATGNVKDLHAALVNLHMMVHTEEQIRRGVLPKKLYDRPDYNKVVFPEK